MVPTVSIVTPSYNKHEYVMEAINSVLDQTIAEWDYWIIDNSTDDLTRQVLHEKLPKDPRIHYLEFDFTPLQRKSFYVPAYICNQVYQELTGVYVFYLSDDDLIMPKCLETMVLFLESNPEASVCYHSQSRMFWRKDHWNEEGGVYTHYILGKDSVFPNVDCSLDGGQILHKRACLDALEYPYFNEHLSSASHSDGMFLQRLANLYKIYPVPVHEPLSIHRITPKSTWTKV
jgi:glycosyltransferase involved in cell wall biosynthesis